MDQPTNFPPAPDTPDCYAWCAYCQDSTDTCRLVAIVEQGSTFGGGVFACAPCREEHCLVPVAEQ